MLNSKSDYRFVPQAAMRKITVEGRILPLRAQKRIPRGEDEAFLEEASIEREFPKQKSDFLNPWTWEVTQPRYYLRVIQRIAGNQETGTGTWDPGEGGISIGNGKNGIGYGLIENAVGHRYLGNTTSPFYNSFDAEDASVAMAAAGGTQFRSVHGSGFLLPWRKDMAFPTQTIERGGYFERNSATESAEDAIESAADDALQEVLDSPTATDRDKYEAWEEYYSTVSARCPYHIGHNGNYLYTGVEFGFEALSVQSYMLDDFRSWKMARQFLPYRWPAIESLFSDSDMMRIKAQVNLAYKRLPYYMKWTEQLSDLGTVYATYNDYGAYHPTLGHLGSAQYTVVANMLGYDDGGYMGSVDSDWSIVSGGTKIVLRLGTRYTAGKIRSVKAIVRVREFDRKRETAGGTTKYWQGYKFQWRTVNFTRKGAVCASECAEIDAIHDDYFAEYKEMYDAYIAEHGDIDYEFLQQYRAKQSEEAAEVEAVVNAKAAAITAKKKEYTDAMSAIDSTFSDEYDAAQQISDREQRQVATKAAYDKRAQSRAALMARYVQEDIWSVDTEGRELWEADIPAIARQMSGGEWDWQSTIEGVIFAAIEYDFGSLTGADLSAYTDEVEVKTDEFWREWFGENG